jgi:hypothetical protein
MKAKLQLLAMLFTSAFGFSQNGIQSNSAPANAEQGSTITASFYYTADAAGTCQIQLFKTNSSGAIDYSAGTAMYFAGPITAAATSTLKSQTFTVPADLPLSSSLPPGVVYKWFFKIEVPAGTPFYSANPTTTIVAPGTLSTKSFNENGVKVIYNAKTKNLVFYDVEKSEMSIYDVKGSSVMRLNTVSQNSTFDLSSLTNGLYFLKSNNGKVYKFLVQ